MSEIMDYRGKKAIIYDQTSELTIAECEILEHNKAMHTILVDGRKLRDLGDKPVSLLIFGGGKVVEYKGNVRAANDLDRVEIALYKGQTKESREAVRYDVHAPASVENLVIAGKAFPLHEPGQVEVLNISTGGVLFRGSSRLLNMGTTFQLRLTLAGSDQVLLNATVVRCIQVSPEKAEYGCRLNFQYE